MAEQKGIGLPETKGMFQVRGVVSGVEKDSFYKELTTKNNRPMRMINFGVQFDPESTMYVGFNGMPQDNVYFTKSEKDETGKKTTITEKIAWKDRFTFKKEGFRLIGVNTGVSKIKDESGNEINDKKILTQYDACKEIDDHLKDDDSVFVRGNITYSTYNNKRQVRFEPNQVSLCKPIDFDDEDGFKPMADFQQTIVFTGISPNEDKSKYIVSAKIVTYNSVEDAEFIIKDAKLAGIFKKNLKPYQSILVYGHINVEKKVEEIEEEDCWGEANSMNRVNSPTVRELVIIGADPKTIEKDVYSEDAIDKAIAKMKANKKVKEEYGDEDEGWGTLDGSPIEDDEDEPW